MMIPMMSKLQSAIAAFPFLHFVAVVVVVNRTTLIVVRLVVVVVAS